MVELLISHRKCTLSLVRGGAAINSAVSHYANSQSIARLRKIGKRVRGHSAPPSPESPVHQLIYSSRLTSFLSKSRKPRSSLAVSSSDRLFQRSSVIGFQAVKSHNPR